MRRVAVKAADIAAGVRGFGKVGLLVRFAVAGQTASARLLPGLPGKHEYLGLVAASRYVFRTRAMAALAALLRRAAFCVKRGLPVWSLRPVVIDVFVAGLTSVCSDILRIRGHRVRQSGVGGRLSALFRDRLLRLPSNAGLDKQDKQDRE